MILIVEDDDSTRELICEVLHSKGHVCDAANGVIEGLAKIEEIKPEVLLLDLVLPDGNPLLLIQAARHAYAGVKIAIMSAKSKPAIEKAFLECAPTIKSLSPSV